MNVESPGRPSAGRTPDPRPGHGGHERRVYVAVSYAPGVSVCGRMIVAPSRIRSRSRPSMLKRRRNANVGAFLVRLYDMSSKAQRGGEVEARGGRRDGFSESNSNWLRAQRGG